MTHPPEGSRWKGLDGNTYRVIKPHPDIAFTVVLANETFGGTFNCQLVTLYQLTTPLDPVIPVVF